MIGFATELGKDETVLRVASGSALERWAVMLPRTTSYPCWSRKTKHLILCALRDQLPLR